MPTNNFKLFDEKKANMMTDEEYAINQQRLNGVQSGVASSQLQNKTLYQTALMCYALAQLMAANGYDANDADAVSTFVNNMSASMVQKVVDKAKASDIVSKTVGKWIDSAQFGALKDSVDKDFLKLSGGTMLGNLILNADPTQNLQAATKQYVDGRAKIEIVSYTGSGQQGIDSSVNITFKEVPKIIFAPVYSDSSSAGLVYLYELETTYKGIQHFYPGIVLNMKKSEDGKTISWNYSGSSHYMFNDAGTKYHCISIS